MSADVWMDGAFLPAEQATVPLLSHALHYGTAVFEGIRVYETPAGPAAFRHREHVDRLYQSAALYAMEVPFAKDELRAATHELVRRSGLRACYVRPLVFRAEGTMTVSPLAARVRVAIALWQWGSYLGEEGKRDGVRAKVSSWRRLGGDAVLPAAKASGHYLNAVLAKLETERAGYDEGILLDQRGMVSEGTGENLFLVCEGVLVTPPIAASILDGITRRSVIEIARDLGIEVVERDVPRQELYVAEELFVTGTAAELTPLREIDDRPVGDGRPGPITLRLQAQLEDALHGRSDRYRAWNDVVGERIPSSTSAAGSGA
jgi:branched-chain amino acid aminotransferase